MQRTKRKKKKGKTKQRLRVGHIPQRGHCPDDGRRIYLKPEAENVATVLSRNSSEVVVPYHCPGGHGWHVGHNFL